MNLSNNTIQYSRVMFMDTADAKRPIRIFVVDAQAQIRRGLTMRLNLEPDLEVVGDSGDGELALRRITALQPDLVLLDLEMPGLQHQQLVAQIQAQRPQCLIVILSLYDDSATEERALATGAAAFVSKRLMDSVLMATIRSVLSKSSASWGVVSGNSACVLGPKTG